MWGILLSLLQLAVPPNILLLFPDQWRFDWDGRDPALPLKLPNIRALMGRGVKFEHAYVPSPLCAPSRAALASGREYDEAGVPTNENNDFPLSIPTFYQSLQRAGYWTATTGKDDLDKATQLGTKFGANWTGVYHQSELGFSDGIRMEGKEDVVDQPQPHERYGHWLSGQTVLLKNGSSMSAWDAHRSCMKGDKCTKSMFPDDLYEDNYVHDKALELLRRRPTNAPFFLHVSFPGPHPPFLVTPVQYDAVDHRSFPPPVDGSSSTPEVCVSTGQPQTSNSDRCDYAAEMENLDRLVGSLLDELFAQGVTESTLVCFASDHGEMLGDHGQVGKGKPWEASASVPLACAGPGVTRGAIESRAVATLDLAATFLDYAGVHPSGYPEGMTSISLRPLLERGHPLGAHETATPPPLPREYVQSGLQSKPFNTTLIRDWAAFNTTLKRDLAAFNTTLNRDWAATPVQTDPVHTQGPVHTQADGWSWRMVVEATTGLKLVCCRGRCPGAPSTIPPLNQTTGYQQVLLNMSQDRYDMHPIQDERWRRRG